MKQVLVLGSESIFRKQVLLDAGYEIEVLPANIDEKAIRSKSAEALTLALAEAKAIEVVKKLQEQGRTGCVITGDQVVEWNGHILEKPESREQAEAQLKSYRFMNPKTVTAVCVWNMENGESAKEVETVEFVVSPFSADEMDIILGDPVTYKCCGALPCGVKDSRAAEIVAKRQTIPEGKVSSVIGMPLDVLNRLLVKTKFIDA